MKVISSSPGELEPVFQAMLENATRICGASFGTMFRFEKGAAQIVAKLGLPQEFFQFLQGKAQRPGPHNAISRLVNTRRTVHITDYSADQSYLDHDPMTVAGVELGGIRTLLVVPMLKDGELLGAIGIYRTEVRSFTDRQIELLTNFAAQAVIAIENTRLLKELRQRMEELSEALDQQTATSEVLRVISSSPGELQPVFDAILKNAVQICEARFGILTLFDGIHHMRHAASYNVPPAFQELRRQEPVVPLKQTVAGRVVETKGVITFADVAAEEGHADSALVKLAGARSAVGVPMLKDDELIGAIVIYRTEVRPFSDKQAKLLKDFAAQAVIAIENTRLLNELRQRTSDLSESLEQQTATSEVLRVISGSPNELRPVFQTMLANATRLCEANFGTLNLYKDGTFPVAAMHDVPAEYAEFRRLNPQFRVLDRHPLARVAATGQVQQIFDMRLEPLYLERDPSFIAMVERAGARTLFLVPMLKDNDVIGVITIFRQEVRPFTDKQIELVKNFAAQAVIAIENTRLLNELRESLEQQKATSEVLRVISSSPGELAPVFQAMLENSVRISEAGFGQMFLCERNAFRVVAHLGVPSALVEWDEQRGVFQPIAGGTLEGLLRTKQAIHIADMSSKHATMPAARLGGARSYIAVPMLQENELIGAIIIYRQDVRPFSGKQIALLQNFAAQAVIAIENTRLLNELRESLRRQTATADVLGVISSSPGELEPVFKSMLENATQICEAKFGTLYLCEDDGFRAAAMHNAPPGYAEARARVVHPPWGTSLWRAANTKQVTQITDVTTTQEYLDGDRFVVSAAALGGYRTVLSVPMLKGDSLVGIITIFRQGAAVHRKAD